MEKKVHAIADVTGGEIIGNAHTLIKGVTGINQPKKDHIMYIEDARYHAAAEKTDIACIIVPESVTRSSKTIIRVKNPKLSFAKVLRLFHPARTYSGTCSPHASIAPSAQIAKGVTIEDSVVIGDRVIIGENSTIRSFTYIDANVIIGEHTIIHPMVMIYDNTQIGNNVIIHSSTVIGSDGFGFVRDDNGNQVKMPQVGNVIIEDNVEIGSNVSIDRATIGATIIKRGVKIDNLVQIAHNVEVGENTAISGQSGIAGSAKIGPNCTIAAGVGIGDHCILENGAIIAGKSGVPSKKKVPANQIFFGTPARPLETFKKQQQIQIKLPAIIQDVEELKKKVEKLEKKKKN
ncbi:MAG: UDP-3-O-(3-hydroxymyristoyl)glucosamine N-acyltransferase [Candidatus Omnitrophica bacterium]|nr:UDP-3-O-(3-hydroxymyristoyl)glucosamine N-acyltransferase [Candidatus Omnitrophota bacterium]